MDLLEILSKYGEQRTTKKGDKVLFFAEDLGLICGYSGASAKTAVKNRFPKTYYWEKVWNPKVKIKTPRVLVDTEQAIEFIKSSKKKQAKEIAKELEEVRVGEQGDII